jgi:hypothetical protein
MAWLELPTQVAAVVAVQATSVLAQAVQGVQVL